MPIFNKWATRSKVKEQKIALQRAKNSLKTKEQELLRALQEAIQNFETFKIEAAEKINQGMEMKVED
ncbi:MAG: TolC family protein [Tenacibaculum sp.]